MATSQAMHNIQDVLLSTQGATGSMLFEGLPHALKQVTEERHELQNELLKMTTQVLCSARSSAIEEAHVTCKRKVDSATAELEARKADVANATEALLAAQATEASKKEKLEDCKRQRISEEEEHARLKGLDEEQAEELSADERSKAEVVDLLTAVDQQGHGERIAAYLNSVKAEAPLVSALRSVLMKEPSERHGFDDLALQHLRAFLEQKIVVWNTRIEERMANKANIHAETLGAWCIKEMSSEHVTTAASELTASGGVVADAQEQLKDAKQVQQQQEATLARLQQEQKLADEQAQRCSTAVEALERLIQGQEEEAASPASDRSCPMDVEVTDAVAAKMEAMMDVDMGEAMVA